MPVIKERFDSRMTIVLQTGTDIDGNALITRKNYNSIKPAASDQAVLAAGVAIANLQTLPLYGVNRTNVGTIEQS